MFPLYGFPCNKLISNVLKVSALDGQQKMSEEEETNNNNFDQSETAQIGATEPTVQDQKEISIELIERKEDIIKKDDSKKEAIDKVHESETSREEFKIVDDTLGKTNEDKIEHVAKQTEIDVIDAKVEEPEALSEPKKTVNGAIPHLSEVMKIKDDDKAAPEPKDEETQPTFETPSDNQKDPKETDDIVMEVDSKENITTTEKDEINEIDGKESVTNIIHTEALEKEQVEVKQSISESILKNNADIDETNESLENDRDISPSNEEQQRRFSLETAEGKDKQLPGTESEDKSKTSRTEKTLQTSSLESPEKNGSLEKDAEEMEIPVDKSELKETVEKEEPSREKSEIISEKENQTGSSQSIEPSKISSEQSGESSVPDKTKDLKTEVPSSDEPSQKSSIDTKEEQSEEKISNEDVNSNEGKGSEIDSIVKSDENKSSQQVKEKVSSTTEQFGETSQSKESATEKEVNDGRDKSSSEDRSEMVSLPAEDLKSDQNKDQGPEITDLIDSGKLEEKSSKDKDEAAKESLEMSDNQKDVKNEDKKEIKEPISGVLELKKILTSDIEARGVESAEPKQEQIELKTNDETQPIGEIKDVEADSPDAVAEEEDEVAGPGRLKGQLKISVVRAENLENKDTLGKSDPYIVIKYKDLVLQSNSVKNSLQPEWNFEASFDLLDDPDQNIEITVKDSDIGKDETLGHLTLTVEKIISLREQTWLDLQDCKSGKILVSSELNEQDSKPEDETEKATTIQSNDDKIGDDAEIKSDTKREEQKAAKESKGFISSLIGTVGGYFYGNKKEQDSRDTPETDHIPREFQMQPTSESDTTSPDLTVKQPIDLKKESEIIREEFDEKESSSENIVKETIVEEKVIGKVDATPEVIKTFDKDVLEKKDEVKEILLKNGQESEQLDQKEIPKEDIQEKQEASKVDIQEKQESLKDVALETQEVLGEKSEEKQEVLQEKYQEKQEVLRENSEEKQEALQEKSEEKQDTLQEKSEEKQDTIQEKSEEKQEALQEKSQEKQEAPQEKPQEKQDTLQEKSQEKQEAPQEKPQEKQEALQETSQEKLEAPQEKSQEKQEILQDKSHDKQEAPKGDIQEKKEAQKVDTLETQEALKEMSQEKQEAPKEDTQDKQDAPQENSNDKQEAPKEDTQEKHEAPQKEEPGQHEAPEMDAPEKEDVERRESSSACFPSQELKWKIVEGSEGIKEIINNLLSLLEELSHSVASQQSIVCMKNELVHYETESIKIKDDAQTDCLSEEKAVKITESLSTVVGEVKSYITESKELSEEAQSSPVSPQEFDKLLSDCQELLTSIETFIKDSPHLVSSPEEFLSAKEVISASTSFNDRKDEDELESINEEAQHEKKSDESSENVVEKESPKTEPEGEVNGRTVDKLQLFFIEIILITFFLSSRTAPS